MDQGYHPSDITYLSNPWHNGVNISELLANTLTDIREFVKEVEHFDSEGRLILPPKLMLIGTEYQVKTKAHALNNLKICLAFLDSLPGFPHIPYSPEHILVRPNALKFLLKCIENYFNFEQAFFIPNGLPKQLQLNTPTQIISNNRRRTPSPNSVYSGRPYAETWKNKKVTFFPSSSSNNIQNNSQNSSIRSRSQSPSKVISSISGRPGSAKVPLQRPSSVSNSRSQSASSISGRASPSSRAIAKKNIPPSSNPYEYKDWKQWVNKVKENPSLIEEDKKSSSPLRKKQEVNSSQMNLLIKKNEMLKERLKVQKKDRYIRSTGKSQSKYDDMILKNDLRIRLKEIDKNLLQDKFNSRNDDSSENSNETGSHSSGRSSVKRSNSKNSLIINSYLTNSNTNLWLPPQSTKLEIDYAQSKIYPNLSNKQLKIIKNWLHKLGINIREGEGGFYNLGTMNQFNEIYEDHSNNFYTTNKITHSNSNSKSTAGSTLIHSNAIKSLNPLPLSHDRLRNGEYYFKLFSILEPQAALQANIMKQLIPTPSTIYEAEINVLKILWVWKIVRSPPLPLEYFILYKEVVSGNKNYIWGFLYEVMQYYSSVRVSEREEDQEDELSQNQTIENKDKQNNELKYKNNDIMPNYTESNNIKGAVPPPPKISSVFVAHPPPIPSSSSESSSQKLPYTLEQRNNLDLSLLDWFHQLGIIKYFLGSLSQQVNTILYLESYIKDGTLLCFLCSHVFHLPINSYLKNPLTYKQCLINVSKVVKLLRLCPSMSKRFLYKNIEDDLIRGNWDAILGLLEDLHVFYDRLELYYNNKTSNYSNAFISKPKSNEAGPLSYIQTLPTFEDVKLNPNSFYLPNDSIIFPYLGKQCLQSYNSDQGNKENYSTQQTLQIKEDTPFYNSVLNSKTPNSLEKKSKKSKKVSFVSPNKINNSPTQNASSFTPDSPDSLNGTQSIDKNLYNKKLLNEKTIPKEKNVRLSADSFLSYVKPQISDTPIVNRHSLPDEQYINNTSSYDMIGAASSSSKN